MKSASHPLVTGVERQSVVRLASSASSAVARTATKPSCSAPRKSTLAYSRALAPFKHKNGWALVVKAGRDSPKHFVGR